MDMRKLNIGVIGTGRIGRMHAEHIAFRVPRARLVAVSDLNRAAAEACAEECGSCAILDSAEEMLGRSDIDAVAICTSSTTHTAIIEAAAAAGKHIFCEKPVDLTLAGIDRAQNAVKKAGVLMQVGFNRRFDESFRRVRKAIVGGEIGQPHSLHIISRDPAPPSVSYVRSSGGMFLDLTIHDFDMANFLLGSRVEKVFAFGAVRISPEIGEAGDVDTATVLLQYEDGTIATIENSRKTTYGYDQRLEVFGSKGSIRAGNAFPDTTIIANETGVRRTVPYSFFIERYRQGYVAEMREFAAAVLSGGPSPVSGEDARVPAVWGLAAGRSLETGLPVCPRDVEGA